MSGGTSSPPASVDRAQVAAVVAWAASLVWLAVAFRSVDLEVWRIEPGCVRLRDGVAGDLRDAGRLPLVALAGCVIASGVRRASIRRPGLPRRVDAPVVVVLTAALIGAVLAPVAYAGDDFETPAAVVVGIVGSALSGVALRLTAAARDRASRRHLRRTWGYATAYLVLSPVAVIAVSRTGEQAFCF